MNKRNIFILILISFCAILSCKKKSDTVTVVFKIKASANKTANGRTYSIDLTKTRVLFSNFKYVDGAGHEALVKDVFLYKSGSNSFTFNIPKDNINYNGFKFSFGLDKATNNSVPMSFAASSPLSVESGMYWDMLKYRFLIVEGMIDNSSTKDQVPSSPFSMHIGTDTMYAEISAAGYPVGGGEIEIDLDMDELFALDADPFQITNFSNHSEPSEISRGVVIKNSFVNSIKVNLFAPD